MFIRVKNKINGKRAVQIVESYRRGSKVSQRIIRHVGQGITDVEVDSLKRIAESIIIETKNNREPVLPIFKPEESYAIKKKTAQDKVVIKNLREEQRIIDGIGDIFGKLYDDLGFSYLIKGTRKDKQWNSILKSMVLARVANPSSKRRTAALLEQDFGIRISLEKIYRTMDHLSNREDEVKSRIINTTLSLFKEKVDVLFFDVTTLYFESIKCDDFREFGFSKDCKFKDTQVMLALITTTSGLPISYELFPGNTYEGHTLIDMIEELQYFYKVDNVLLVADRAMFNQANLDHMDRNGINYIVAAKLKNLTKDVKKNILDKNYRLTSVQESFYWVKEIEYKSRRLIVSYSNRRARKDAADRQRLIDRLIKKVKNGKIKLSEIIPNYGTKKYIRVANNNAYINETKIADDAKWDGLHGVITNAQKTPEEILSSYSGLWQIEAAFRLNKHDLMMRPIFHWTQRRIKAHISICFIAYTLIKQALHRIGIQHKAMSFEKLRNELLHTQSSLIVDIETKKKYLLPSHVTALQKKLYQIFGLKRSDVPLEII